VPLSAPLMMVVAAHPRHAPERFPPRRPAGKAHEPAPVIADFQTGRAAMEIEQDPDRLGACVLERVVERFLGDLVQLLRS